MTKYHGDGTSKVDEDEAFHQADFFQPLDGLGTQMHEGLI
jgi:hypothetical protein